MGSLAAELTELRQYLTPQELAEVDRLLRTRIPKPAEFIRRLTIEDPQADGQVGIIPFDTWPAQDEMLTEIEHSMRVIILKARQLGISWLLCGYALWKCLYWPMKTGLIFSKGLEEAAEMVRRIQGMYNRMPDSMKVDLPVMTGNTEELKFSNGSRIKAQAATKTAGSSFTASFVLADEFAKMVWANDLYTSMKPTVDGGGQLIIVSTAVGNSNLFASLWEKAAAGLNSFKPLFLNWRARPDRDDAWYAGVARDSISEALLQQEYPNTPAEAFSASDTEKFLADMFLWDRCRWDEPHWDKRVPIVLAADAGVNNDSFALVGVSRHPQANDAIAVRVVREWKPPRNGQIDFSAVEAAITQVCNTWNVVQLAYDPYQLHDMATRLQRNGTVMTREFNQANDRLEADKGLHDLIVQTRIFHDGTNPLREHVDNANKKVDTESRKIRIVKRESSRKIDLAVALSMASYRCLKLPL